MITFDDVYDIKKNGALVIGRNRLDDYATKFLSKYCKEENILTGAVFLGNRKTPISREAVWKMLKYLSGMAGLDEKKVHPHSFRHYFAISYMERFSNMFELADILGHSNLETTRIYTSTSVEHKRKKINELDRW